MELNGSGHGNKALLGFFLFDFCRNTTAGSPRRGGTCAGCAKLTTTPGTRRRRRSTRSWGRRPARPTAARPRCATRTMGTRRMRTSSAASAASTRTRGSWSSVKSAWWGAQREPALSSSSSPQQVPVCLVALINSSGLLFPLYKRSDSLFTEKMQLILSRGAGAAPVPALGREKLILKFWVFTLSVAWRSSLSADVVWNSS